MTPTHALLLTDVVDSTALAGSLGTGSLGTGSLGDAVLAALWAAHDRVARDLLAEHGGLEIDKTDGFLLLFDEAAGAVLYALAYHRALAALTPPLRARAGLHVGTVILTENSPADVARGAKPLEVDGQAKPTAARVMGLAQGGQTLLSSEARQALGPTHLRIESHGHWRLKGVAEPIELFEVGDDTAPFTPPPDGAKIYRVVREAGLWLALRHVKHGLPSERDAFVGRESDLQELSLRLDGGAHLVTVLGIGGTGKTRLVTRFAWTWLGDYPGGAWFCDLSEARSVEGILQAVARGLDVALGKDDPLEQLGHAIAGRGECLVILDNFEQVARHAEETLGRWLDRASAAHFIVTTREVLGLPGETTVALAPLRTAEAVELFSARAAQAQRDFVLAEADLAHVQALVKLLDGLPLAIELAAARVRVMSPKVLLERMSQRFKLLSSSGGRHTRQATLRATLDWSWDLLSKDEQEALAQLSVFEGGFTLPAAEAVLALAELWPVDAVQALVDKSLVRRVTDERFDLLVSVQEYATEKLESMGSRGEAEARHGAHFASHGSAAAITALSTHGGVERRRALHADLDNLVAACRRAAARGAGEVAAATLEAAWAVLELRGPTVLGTELAPVVLAIPGLAAGPRAAASCVLGFALQLVGLGAEARPHHEAALASARAEGDRRREGLVLVYLGFLLREHGLHDEALAALHLALAAAREAGEGAIESRAHGEIGNVRWVQGRRDEAQRGYETALDLARQAGDRRGEGGCLCNLGNLLGEQGWLAEADVRYQEALVVNRDVDDRRMECGVLSNLGHVCAQMGRFDESLAYFEAALALLREVGDRRFEGITIANLGQLRAEQGLVAEARAAFKEALAIHRAMAFTEGLWDPLMGLARLEATVGSAAWESLADEAVSVTAANPEYHAEALASRAELRVGAGGFALARADVDAARTLGRAGRAGVLVALSDARVCHAEGSTDAARTAVGEARGLVKGLGLGPASSLGKRLAGVEALLAGAAS